MQRSFVLLAAVAALAFALPATAATDARSERAPEIAGTTLNGKKLSLAWYRTRTVFLNLWASW